MLKKLNCTDKNILVFGIGGGCDIISAIGLGKGFTLPSNTRYANTKSMRTSILNPMGTCSCLLVKRGNKFYERITKHSVNVG